MQANPLVVSGNPNSSTVNPATVGPTKFPKANEQDHKPEKDFFDCEHFNKGCVTFNRLQEIKR